MNYYTKTFTKVPPLIILRGYELIISGSQNETRRWLKQEHMRRSNAFVIYDPCGCLFKRHEKDFIRNGYDIKTLNAPCFCNSEKYNPFEYINTDEDIQIIANAVIEGTKGNGKADDIGFTLAENLLLSSLISYVHENLPGYERHLGTVLEMLEKIDLNRDYWEGYKTVIDIMLEVQEEANPFHLSVRLYKQFKELARKNELKIIESCVKRLLPLNFTEAGESMAEDELELDNLLLSKTVLFVRTINPYPAFQFIIPLMYTQLINTISRKIIQ